ncbi:iron uptake porin [Leptolyngbya sp. FACHB-17]|uniref:iron uptake porin n=1 Tax=unclassified Leptolyngbya TaxID=2650499 RepID=UPI001680BCC4|nr:iron uptake porin [Leptolyngbya sp. FACHB-17]MBD2083141.1 carbohydrate porin [Leptolyngbya sp. FACHB-17]
MKFASFTCLVTIAASSLLLAPLSVRAAEPEIVPANPQIQNSLDQVTSVSQLSDVRPTDWAFQALQSLVERYGCIAGYPDRTYRGNRALTRFEFAAGLNACLNRVNELIAASTADLVKKEDLATLQKLQEQFAVELATIRGRVDALEARTTTLERQQFSVTTKLQGEAIVAAISVLAGDNAITSTRAERNPTLSYRVRLNLNTSFTGRDLLTTRLQANNVTPLGQTAQDPTSPTGIRGLGVLGTNMGRVEFDGDSGGQVGLALLRYRFPLGENTDAFLAGTGNGFVDLDASSQLNPYFDGGAVSLFGLRNPIYNYSFGAGFGIRHRIGTAAEVNLGYLVPNAANPANKSGLFNGQYGALAQVILNLSPSSRIGFTYINAYAPFGADLQPDDPFNLSATGSNLANSNFGGPVSINAYGISGTFQVSPNFALGGWVGYANHNYIGQGRGDVWNWAVTLAFPDLFKKGNLGGLFVGQEPKLTRSDLGFRDRSNSLHLEAFYRHRINDNISITPGVIWVTNPDFNTNNEDVVVGVIRTVFSF